MSPFSRGKSILLGLLTCLLFFLGLEVAIRLLQSVRDDVTKLRAPEEPSGWYVLSPKLGWAKKPGYAGPVERDTRRFDSEGFLSVDSKQVSDSAEPKVLLLGDSNTFGYGVPAEATFAEVADDLLPGISTINLGVNGYSSFQGRKLLEEYLPRLRPAAVVASFNFNDRRAIVGDQNADGSEHFQRISESPDSVWDALNAGLEPIHMYRAMRTLMRSLGLLPKRTERYRVDQFRPRVNEQQYRENLSAMAAETERLGIPLILIVLRDNPLMTGHLKRGIEKLETGDYEAAIEYLEIPLKANYGFSDMARSYLAQAYRAKGDPASAEAILRTDGLESLHGGRPIRLDTAYNRVMIEVAREHHAEVIDAASVLEQDPYVFIDICHFNTTGHRRVGELLAERLSALLGPPSTNTRSSAGHAPGGLLAR
jgi:lysophospholipase L1-like esterase